MALPRYVGFEKTSIEFLEQLAANNNREWFNENKARYEEHVLDVALRFIQSMQDPLAQMQVTDIPALVYGPLSDDVHGFDERVELESVRRIAQATALFIAEWCGLEAA